MPANRRTKLAIASVTLLGCAIAIPASIAAADEIVVAAPMLAPPLGYDIPASVIADDAVVAAEPDAATLVDAAEATADASNSAATAAASVDERELDCMAKVVHHEAANQSRRGQLAVAQLIRNRAESGRFPATICGVVNQPGQFFQTASYNPRRSSAQWAMAVDVSREALSRGSPDVIPGAMFYHAAYQAPTRWFRTRERVAQLEDHVFYR